MKKRLLTASFALACAAVVGAQNSPSASSSTKTVTLPPGATVITPAGKPPFVQLPDGTQLSMEQLLEGQGEDVEAQDAPASAPQDAAAAATPPAAGDAAIAPYLQMQPLRASRRTC